MSQAQASARGRALRAAADINREYDVLIEDQNYLDALRFAEARAHFYKYREIIRPNAEWNWFTDDTADKLQKFAHDMMAGRNPILALEAPPRHGKSWTVRDFITWAYGKWPELNTIFASYSEDLGKQTNLQVLRTCTGERFRNIFPNTRCGEYGLATNLNQIEFAKLLDDNGREVGGGTFRNTTVEGPITGFGFNLGVIDDPHKGRKEASSQLHRDNIWNWLIDDFMTRLEGNYGLILLMTRWHIDDALGRALIKFKNLNITEIKYPAIAIKNEPFRRKGEALIPKLRSKKMLLERKATMTPASWESLYQQSPYLPGGGRIPINKMRLKTDTREALSQIVTSVRYWDKAGTAQDEEGGEAAAYTAGVLMHKLQDNSYMISDIVRGKWGAYEREETIKNTSLVDYRRFLNYRVYVEREPGSGGKDSALATIAMLTNLNIAAFEDIVSGQGAKEVRAEPFEAAVMGNRVWLLIAGGLWYNGWRDEVNEWPNGRYKDQVDAAAGAFNRLNSEPGFDYLLRGFDPEYVDPDSVAEQQPQRYVR